MPTIDDLWAKLNSIEALIGGLRDKLQVTPSQIVITEGLSDISNALGLVEAGEGRFGNREQPGEGFSGVRIVYPPVNYGGSLYNIAGVDADTLMFGLRSSDGAGVFAGGQGIIDVNGLAFDDTASINAFRVFGVDQTYNGESMGAGDVLLGDNSTGKTNMLWDASAGELQIRRDATVVNRVASGQALSLGGCRVTKTTNQVLTNNTWTVITFDNEDYDDAGFHSTDANLGRMTIPAGYAGRYIMSAFAIFDAAANGERAYRILKNASTTAGNYLAVQGEVFDAGTAQGAQTLLVAGVTLSSGDYVEFSANQNSGSTLDIASGYRPCFVIQRVA